MHRVGQLREPDRRQDGNHARYSISDPSVFDLCEPVCGGLCEPVCGGVRRQVDEFGALLETGETS